MKVIYADGTVEKASGELKNKLYIEGRLTKEAWQELLDTMKENGIVKFEDSLVKKFGIEFVTIGYVTNQVKHLSM